MDLLIASPMQTSPVWVNGSLRPGSKAWPAFAVPLSSAGVAHNRRRDAAQLIDPTRDGAELT